MLAYRNSETWIGASRVFVTEPGFPWGRRLVNPPVQGTPTSRTESDPGRFTGLALLYSNLATTDPILRILRKSGPFKSKITAAPLLANADGDTLPIIGISATGSTKEAANANTRRATNALITFIRQQQEANKIPDDDRVVLELIQSPKKAILLTGRPKVVPLVIFVGLMGLVIGLALLLENLRPRSSTEMRAQEGLASDLPISTKIRAEPEPEFEPEAESDPESDPESGSKPPTRLRRPA